MSTMNAEDEMPGEQAGSEGQSTVPPAGIVSWLRRLHFLGGLAVAPFLLVICVTGIINAFTPQIVDAVHGDQLYTATHAGPQRLLSEQVTAARSAHPDAELKSVVVPAGDGRSNRIVLSVAGLPDIDSFSDEDLTVYVDPHTARILGEGVTVKDRPSAQVWLRQLHGNLHLGEPGRLYSEFATSWLPLLVIAGFVLAVVRRRRRRVVAADGAGAARAWDVRRAHATLGVVFSVLLVAIAVTGMPQSSHVGDRIDQVVGTFGLTAREPEVDEVPVRPGAPTISIDQALAAARSTGLQGDLAITMPSATGETVRAEEKPHGWPIDSDVVTLDPYSAELLEHIEWADQPLAARVITVGNYLHDGTLFGAPNQIVVVAVATAATALLVLAYVMWWRRRPYGRSSGSTRDTDDRTLSPGTAICVLATALALVWLVPLLGLSLLVFILVDLLLRRRSRSIGRQEKSGGPVGRSDRPG